MQTNRLAQHRSILSVFADSNKEMDGAAVGRTEMDGRIGGDAIALSLSDAERLI